MERININRHLTTAILATILMFSALQSVIPTVSSDIPILPQASMTIFDSLEDLMYVYTGEPAEEYFDFVDVELVQLELKGEALELDCTITVREEPPVELENTVWYNLMFDENNDTSDNFMHYPYEDIDTMYTVIYTETEGWTIERAKYQVMGGWFVEDTEAWFGLASSMPGGFSIDIRIPLTELPTLTGILPWKVLTQTFTYPSTFPDTGDFVPDVGLAYLRPQYEMFGPRADRLLIKMYEDEPEMFLALEKGEIDIACQVGDIPRYSDYYTGGTDGAPVIPNDGENKYRGRPWIGIVDQTYWSFLNMHPQDYELGDGEHMTIRCGCTLEITSLNPIYAELRSLGLDGLFDSLLKRDPYTFETMPWLAESYTVGTWINPDTGENCSKVKFTLRPDATWHDGTLLTIADIYFTFVEIDDLLAMRGLPPPWWNASVKPILSFDISDPYNFEVLCESVTDISAFATCPCIVPMHIWKPIIESGDPTAFAPDPNVIGSGPWKLKEYVEGGYILLVANTIGADMTIGLKDYFKYSPVECYVDLPTSRVYPDTYVETNIVVRNLFAVSQVDVVVFVYFDGELIDIRTLTLSPNSQLLLGSYSFNITGGFHWISATCILISEELPGRDHEDFKWVWATIREDIAGSYDITNQFPEPDMIVNIKDIFILASAFGSYPGHESWSAIADIDANYKIDIRDIFQIAKNFGFNQQIVTEKENVQRWPPIDGKKEEDLDSVPVQKPDRWHKENIDGVDGVDYLLSNQTDKDNNIVQLWILNNGQYGVRYYDAKSKKWVWIGKCPYVTGNNSNSFKEKKEGQFTKVKWISKCDRHPNPGSQIGTPGDRWEYEYDVKTGKLTAKKYNSGNEKIGGPDDPFDPPDTPGGLPGP